MTNVLQHIMQSGEDGRLVMAAKNYRKSADQMPALLHVLDCELDQVVRTMGPSGGRAA